jgi:hypothetical protein
MLKTPEIAPANVTDVLRVTDRTLKAAITSVLGEPPLLEVVAQWRPEAPHPPWVSPPLAADASLLGRVTGYRYEGAALSHNIAYADLSAIEPRVAEDLRSGRTNLGTLFTEMNIARYGFEWGVEADAPQLTAEYERLLAGRTAELRPYVWRRYLAGFGGAAMFIVIEALPIRTWERIFTCFAGRLKRKELVWTGPKNRR